MFLQLHIYHFLLVACLQVQLQFLFKNTQHFCLISRLLIKFAAVNKDFDKSI